MILEAVPVPLSPGGAEGLSPGAEAAVRHLPLVGAADALRAGSVDALLVAGGVPLPVLSELDDRFGLRFLPLAGLLPRLGGPGGQASSGLEEVSLPQDAYRAAGGVAAIRVSNLLVCRPELPRGVA
ncbi:hypothetical protein [Streptomyces sp. NPDC059272]|uniref:hypothetical protein n=1 Tax=Streptomyces sp. NPDC059272 TaxID=3346800 RepID=UPI0036929580